MTDVAAPPIAVVTGASGWLGQNLVRALAPERERVVCLVPTADDGARLVRVVVAYLHFAVPLRAQKKALSDKKCSQKHFPPYPYSSLTPEALTTCSQDR